MERLIIGQKHGESEQPSSRASWNTPHPVPRTGMSYGGRMALSFALTSLVTVIILASVVTVVWGGAFSDYTRSNVEEIAQVAAMKLAREYEQEAGGPPRPYGASPSPARCPMTSACRSPTPTG